MNAVELLRQESALAYADLQQALDGVTEGQAWAVLPQGGADYLNTDGSIYGLTLHVATCKRIYGSVGFRSSTPHVEEPGELYDRLSYGASTTATGR